MINSYKDLIVWQKGINLVSDIYQLTKNFPKEELYGLTSQIRRAAVSIPANIAEGRHRGTRKDFGQFLRIAYASGAELETEIIIAQKLNLPGNYQKIIFQLDEIMRMLNVMIRKLNPARIEARS